MRVCKKDEITSLEDRLMGVNYGPSCVLVNLTESPSVRDQQPGTSQERVSLSFV